VSDEPRRQGPDEQPDFAGEHTKPTYSDEPSTEDGDESVPSGKGGDGGTDIGQQVRPE
jgi:hypothetical protein